MSWAVLFHRTSPSAESSVLNLGHLLLEFVIWVKASVRGGTCAITARRRGHDHDERSQAGKVDLVGGMAAAGRDYILYFWY